MQINLGNHVANFRPWKPSLGAVFSSIFAFDCETTLIDELNPQIVPTYVIGAAYDGHDGYFISRDSLQGFLLAHQHLPVIMHNAAFDLAVIQATVQDWDVYSLVDRSLVWDTRILHRLHSLATLGRTAFGDGQSTLDACVASHLGLELPKDVVDSNGVNVRTSFGQWLGEPPNTIPPVYLDYLAKDPIATYWLHRELIDKIEDLLSNSHEVWGYVSDEWIVEQFEKWGPLTHHIQLKAAIVLDDLHRVGMGLDIELATEHIRQLERARDEFQKQLLADGYAPGHGSQKALQRIIQRIAAQSPQLELQTTPSGQISTTAEALSGMRGHPFIDALFGYRVTEKLITTFLEKFKRPRIHPSFDILKNTGRTSSFGDINAQNLPKDERVRACFVPAAGHVFVNADYSTIELATLAQAIETQFGVQSEMGAAINAGNDLHTLVAADVTRKPPEKVTAAERKKAKVINFGKPGGMGNATLAKTALHSYGIAMTEEEVALLSDSWLNRFPEMSGFLQNEVDIGSRAAELFGITGDDYVEHTGRIWHNAVDATGPLGGMLLKALKEPSPATRNGRAYTDEELDYFWSCAERCDHLFPESLRLSIAQREASEKLSRAAKNLAGRGSVFTLTGRLRANATYCARRNTIFQGLAADGAKIGLWRLWRAGYRIINFIHDEVLIEVPDGPDLVAHANEIRQLMIGGMREVVSDIRVEVELGLMDRWSTEAPKHRGEISEAAVWRLPCAAVAS